MALDTYRTHFFLTLIRRLGFHYTQMVSLLHRVIRTLVSFTERVCLCLVEAREEQWTISTNCRCEKLAPTELHYCSMWSHTNLIFILCCWTFSFPRIWPLRHDGEQSIHQSQTSHIIDFATLALLTMTLFTFLEDTMWVALIFSIEAYEWCSHLIFWF